MRKLLIGLVLAIVASATFAVAQDDERSRFVRFVERQISTPDRQIRLGRIQGALSSDVRISSISIADSEGTWLTIEDVHLVWSRWALLRGRLDVDLLEASAIRIDRTPVPGENDEPLEEGAEFSVPELPVSILIDSLKVPEVAIAEGVIGPAASIGVDGSITLDGGTLDAKLDIERKDRPGQLTIAANFSNSSRQLGIDVVLEEPEDGVIANALNIDGKPPIRFAIKGEGPLANFEADLDLTASGDTLLSGTTRLAEANGGMRILANLDGNLTSLVADLYDPFVAGGTRLDVDATRRADGSILLQKVDMESGAARLQIAGEMAADGVPTRLSVNGDLGRSDGEALVLPGGGGDATIGSATIDVSLGSAADGSFTADIVMKDLDTPFISSPNASLKAAGTARNLADAATRSIDFTVTGRADGVVSDDGGVADAVGSALALDIAGDWKAGSPVNVANASLATDVLNASFQGTILDALDGTYRLSADSLAAFSALAGRELGGSIDLGARGHVGFDGLFDLTVDASSNNLAVGVPAADGLLDGETTIAGRAARSAEGVTFDTFKIDNPQLSVAVDGTVDADEANLLAEADLHSLAAVDKRLGGALSARLSVSGQPAKPTLSARLTSDAVRLDKQNLTGLTVAFDGTLAQNTEIPFDLDGTLSVDGRLESETIRLSTRIDTGDGLRELRALTAEIAGARLNGDLELRDTGLMVGDLAFDVPSLARLAPLALTEASGSLSGKVTLGVREVDEDVSVQTATIDAEARQVAAAGLELGYANIAMAVDDVFNIPALDGTADVRTLKVAGFDVRTASLRARRDNDTTNLTVSADLGSGTLDAAGSLARAENGFTARLDTFNLARDGFAARLTAPTTVAVEGVRVTIGDTTLRVADGTVKVAGSVGDSLDLKATIDRLPLSIANLVRPDLGLGGTVSADLTLSGTRDEPAVDARLSAEGVTAAMLARSGIRPLSLTAAGQYADGSGTLQRFETNLSGGRITAAGTIGETLDVNITVDGLPLALANVADPSLGLGGAASGRATVTGSFDDPAADFSLNVDGATAAMLRQANIAPLRANVSGRYADEEATIATAQVVIGEGTVTASGTVGRRLDVRARLDRLPLAVANAFVPDLGVTGTLSGDVTATGPLARPSVTFRLDAPAVSANAIRDAGFAPASLTASGTFDRGTVDLTEAVVRLGGGSVRAAGRVGQRMRVTVDITSFPLAVANGFSPGLGLSGTLAGRAAAQGSIDNPAATFELDVAGLSASALSDAGISGLRANASGRLANNTVRLEAASVTGAGLDVAASGVVPLSGGGINVTARARAPLSLADHFLRERGGRVTGDVVVNARVTGSLANPLVNGEVQADGVGFRDPGSNLTLSNGTVRISLDGDHVNIRTLSATLGEGTVSITGGVGLSNGFPADLAVRIRNARYADGELFAVTLSGDLTVSGPLLAGPLVRGTVDVDRAEINVPTRLSGSAALIDVHYVNPSPKVLETLWRAKAGPYRDRDSNDASFSGLTLDVKISAPRRVFVRGRGIDAELGGEMTLTGPISDISPVGRFDLVRGRLLILGQRVTFTEGSATLLGDLNPTIHLVAETTANSVTVRVIVDGSANNPDITFESDPVLPQDEVLAQLLFGRSIEDLSVFQVAQLAAAVAELAGSGSGPSIMEQVRVFSGLDNLEIITGEDGSTSVAAGRYIADNVYLGVQAGAESSGVTLNIDIARGLKFRGAALTNETTVGLYYEREY
ncbi:translocation/assembly module TamB domain-containing protein [Acuticoccus mangrovi]|uniref:Translocation/assembly module TamB domain-containing protein n=1 Tax=Acuticoccus mangrovi TaxID=2796142 RepID=A0A934MFF1_9HYPH|nr:translocation/assembly module TamB domain-containing protein [Acuticoccus mangrovi]MBJ3778602.1 translocation/assembly module TamB domain-containing protein [Acuticoccus mangrovi]